MMYQRELARWKEMVAACTDPSFPAYNWNGKLGVILDPKWKSFDNFISDIGPMPGYNSYLDREPGTNCFSIETTKWRLTKEKTLTNAQGITRTISEWAIECNLNKATISSRIRRNLPVSQILAPNYLPIKKLINRRFGMLVVTEPITARGALSLWRCKCDCGNRIRLTNKLLLTGKIKSCGCVASNNVKTCPDRLYYNSRYYKLEQLSKTYKIPIKEIRKRIRMGWTMEQTLGVETQPIIKKGTRKLSLLTGIPEATLAYRKSIGISPNEITTPLTISKAKLYEYDGLCMDLNQWAEYLNINIHTLRQRLYSGWSFEDAIRTPSKSNKLP